VMAGAPPPSAEDAQRWKQEEIQALQQRSRGMLQLVGRADEERRPRSSALLSASEAPSPQGTSGRQAPPELQASDLCALLRQELHGEVDLRERLHSELLDWQQSFRSQGSSLQSKAEAREVQLQQNVAEASAEARSWQTRLEQEQKTWSEEKRRLRASHKGALAEEAERQRRQGVEELVQSKRLQSEAREEGQRKLRTAEARQARRSEALQEAELRRGAEAAGLLLGTEQAACKAAELAAQELLCTEQLLHGALQEQEAAASAAVTSQTLRARLAEEEAKASAQRCYSTQLELHAAASWHKVASQTMACERQEVEEALQHCQHKLGAEEASAAEAASSAAAAVARAERLQVALVAAQSTEVAEASEAAVQAERAACVAAGLHRQLLSQESEVSHLEAWLGEEVEVAQAWQDSREELAVELTHCSRHAESFGTRAEELQLALHAQARRADELQGVLGEETRRADELQRALLEASSSSEQLQAFLKKDNSERQQQRQQQEQQQQQQSLALTALRDRHSHEEVGAAQQARETLDKLEASQRSQFEHLHRSCEAALGGLPLEFFQEVRQKSMSLRESEAKKSAEREGGISLREGCLVAEQYAAILDAVAGCVSSLLRENTQLQDANRALAPKQHLLVLSVGKNNSNNNKSSVRSTKAAGASGLQPESPGAAAALSDSESLASGSAALRRPGSDSASAEEDSGEKQQQQQQHQQQQQQHQQQQQQQQKGGDSCGVNFNSNDNHNHNNNNNSNNGNNNIESISGGSEAGTPVSCHNRGTGGTGGDGPELSRQLWAVRQELAASREENRQVLSARRRVQQDTHVKTESRVSLLVSQCEDAGWQAHRLQSELTDQGRSHQEDVRKLRAEILRLEQQQQQ
ncbi:unnamed protein product, partial [Polarella glacialis]